jgi:predicted DsbA family dithiol-disulfide isomerase
LTAAGKTVTYVPNINRSNDRRRGVSETIKVEIFYDYGCPYVHAAAVWVDSVKAELGDRLQVNWRYFPLEQVNSTEGPEWKLWEQPADYKSRGRGAFHGAIAARNQGEDAFERFHLALLRAKHEDGKEHSRRETLLEAAQAANLDLKRFERDLDDSSLLAKIGPDYEEAREQYGVFGTPTFVFEDGSSAYIKMRPAAPNGDAVTVFEDFVQTVQGRPYIAEIKRPTKPAP